MNEVTFFPRVQFWKFHLVCLYICRQLSEIITVSLEQQYLHEAFF